MYQVFIEMWLPGNMFLVVVNGSLLQQLEVSDYWLTFETFVKAKIKKYICLFCFIFKFVQNVLVMY